MSAAGGSTVTSSASAATATAIATPSPSIALASTSAPESAAPSVSASSASSSKPKWLTLKEQGNVQVSCGNYAEAIDLFTRALAQDESSFIEILDRLTLAHMELGDLHSALRYGLTTCAVDRSISNQSWLRLGLVFESMKEYSAAMRCAMTSVSFHTPKDNPNAVFTTFHSSELLCERLKKLSTEPKTGRETVLCAIRFIINKSTSGSISSSTTIDAVEPDIDLRGAVRLKEEGNRLYKQADARQQAIECWKKALTFFTPRAVLLSNRAFCEFKLDHLSNAIHDSHAALTLDPTLVKAMYRQADALFQLKIYNLARLVCGQGIEMTKDSKVLASFAQLQLQIQATSGSVTSSSSSPVNAVATNEWLTFNSEAMVQLQAKKYQAAISSFTLALTCGPSVDEQTLFCDILVGLCTHFVAIVRSGIDRGWMPSFDFFVAAISYHLAARTMLISTQHKFIDTIIDSLWSSVTSVMHQPEYIDSAICRAIRAIGAQSMDTLTIMMELRIIIRTPPIRFEGTDIPSPPVSMEEALRVFKLGQLISTRLGFERVGVGSHCLQALSAFTPRASVLSNRALAHLHSNLPTECVIDSMMALLLDPNHVAALPCQANALVEMKEYDLARMVCERGVKMTKDPQFIASFNKILQSIQAVPTPGSTPSSSSSSSSTSSPKDWLALKDEGNVFVRSGSYSSAVSSFTRALEFGVQLPSDSNDRTLLANLLIMLSTFSNQRIQNSMKRGFLPEREIMVSAVNYGAAAFALLLHNKTMGKHMNAMASLREAMKKIGGSEVLKQEGKLDQLFMIKYANEQMEMAATTVLPKETWSVEEATKLYQQACPLLLKDNSNKDAEILLQHALTAFTPRAVLLSNRALCHLKLNKPLEAIYDTHAALALDPTQVKAFYRQAQAFLQLKEYDAAHTACKQGSKMAKDDELLASFSELTLSIQDASGATPTPSSSSKTEASFSSATLPSISTLAAQHTSLSADSQESKWNSEGLELYRTQKYTSAIASFTRALTCGSSSQEKTLLVDLLSGLTLHYAAITKSAMNRGAFPLSHDFVAAISYHLAARGMHAPSLTSQGTLDIAVGNMWTALPDIMRLPDYNESEIGRTITASKISNGEGPEMMSLRIVIRHPLPQSHRPSTLTSANAITMQEAIRLYQEGEKLFNKSKTNTQAVQLWLKALSVFTPRASVFLYRAMSHLQLNLAAPNTETLIDGSTALLFDSNLVGVDLCLASALFDLKEYEFAKFLCDRGVKRTKDQDLVKSFIKIGRSIQDATRRSTSASTATVSSDLNLQGYNKVQECIALMKAEKYEKAISAFTDTIEGRDGETSSGSASNFPAIVALVGTYYVREVTSALQKLVIPSASNVIAALSWSAATRSVDRSCTAILSTSLIPEMNAAIKALLASEGFNKVLDEARCYPKWSVIDRKPNEKEIVLMSIRAAINHPRTTANTQRISGDERDRLLLEAQDLIVTGKRAEGNELVLKSLAGFNPGVIIILTNRARCYLNLKKPRDALLDAHAALMLDPALVEAMEIQVDALHQLKEYEAARVVCLRGMNLTEDHATMESFQHMLDQIRAAIRSVSSSTNPSSTSAASSPSSSGSKSKPKGKQNKKKSSDDDAPILACTRDIERDSPFTLRTCINLCWLHTDMAELLRVDSSKKKREIAKEHVTLALHYSLAACIIDSHAADAWKVLADAFQVAEDKDAYNWCMIESAQHNSPNPALRALRDGGLKHSTGSKALTREKVIMRCVRYILTHDHEMPNATPISIDTARTVFPEACRRWNAGETSDALVTEFEKVLSAFRSNADLFANRGSIYLDRAKPYDALQDSTTASLFNPTDSMPLFFQAVALNQLKEYELVKSVCDRALVMTQDKKLVDEFTKLRNEALGALNKVKPSSTSTAATSSALQSTPSSAATSSIPTNLTLKTQSEEWRKLDDEGKKLLDAEKYKAAISTFTRALEYGASPAERTLLSALLVSLTVHYAFSATVTMNRGVMPPNNILLSAIYYHLAASHMTSLSSTQKEKIDGRISEMWSCVRTAMHQPQFANNEFLQVLLTTKHPTSHPVPVMTCLEILTRSPLGETLRAEFESSTLVSMEEATRLLSEAQAILDKAPANTKIGPILLKALSVFIPRASVLTGRALAHSKSKSYTQALIDGTLTLLLNPLLASARLVQADALYDLKLYDLSKSICDLAVNSKSTKDQSLIAAFIRVGRLARDAIAASSSSQQRVSSTSTSVKPKSKTFASEAAPSKSASSSSSSSSLEPTLDDWERLLREGNAHLEASRFDQATSVYTHALHCDAKTEIESKLLVALLTNVSACYSQIANTAIDGDKIAPSHTDILNALSYGVAAYAIDATSTESLHAAFTLLTRYFLLGLSDSSVLASIMESIRPPVSNEAVSLHIMRYICHEQEKHELDRSATLVKLKDSEVMTMSDAAQWLKYGQMLNRRPGKSKVAIKLWMRALTLFVPRAICIANRGFCHMPKNALLQSILDSHTSFLLEAQLDRLLPMMGNQATALMMLKEFDSARLVAKRGLKMAAKDDQASRHRFTYTLEQLDLAAKETKSFSSFEHALSASTPSSTMSISSDRVSSSSTAAAVENTASGWSPSSAATSTAFLTGVKKKYPVGSAVYTKLLTLMKDFKDKARPLEQTTKAVSQLFQKEKNLIIGFKLFTDANELVTAFTSTATTSASSSTVPSVF